MRKVNVYNECEWAVVSIVHGASCWTGAPLTSGAKFEPYLTRQEAVRAAEEAEAGEPGGVFYVVKVILQSDGGKRG